MMYYLDFMEYILARIVKQIKFHVKRQCTSRERLNRHFFCAEVLLETGFVGS